MPLTEALGATDSTAEDDELERAVLESESIDSSGTPDDLISAMTRSIADTMALDDADANTRSGSGSGSGSREIQRSDHPDDRAGDIIHERYELLRLLGQGGMGTVYLARHTTLPKTFAVKVLNRRYAKRKDIADRFLQEAKAVSLISHENVVGVVDFGSEADGSAFLVMEHLQGESMSAICKREAPFTWDRVAHIMGQICRALQAAHEVGVVHRDIKPENVLRVGRHEDPDFIKVLDFGLAKLQVSGGLRLTRTGMVLGTPDYMSPEQARGRPTDHRADIYGAGVMMYELLCGRVPFQATTFEAMRQKHLLEPPDPPSKWAPEAGISDQMDAIVLCALAKDPDHRFASMAEMGAAIAGVGALGSAPIELRERRTMPLLTERSVLEGRRRGPHGSGLPIGPTLPIGALEQRPTPSPAPQVVLAAGTDELQGPRRRRAGVIVGLVAALGLGAAGLVAAPALGLFEGGEATMVRAPVEAKPGEPTIANADRATLRFHTNVPVTVHDVEGRGIEVRAVGEDGDLAEVTVVRGEAPLQLLLQAEGYRDLRVVVTPNEDRELEYLLEPVADGVGDGDADGDADAEPAELVEAPAPAPAPAPKLAPKPKPAPAPKPAPKAVAEPEPEPEPPVEEHSMAKEIVDPFAKIKP